jgi:hypothetical protein
MDPADVGALVATMMGAHGSIVTSTPAWTVRPEDGPRRAISDNASESHRARDDVPVKLSR